MVTKGESHVFKKLSAAEAFKSVYMRESVKSVFIYEEILLLPHGFQKLSTAEEPYNLSGLLTIWHLSNNGVFSNQWFRIARVVDSGYTEQVLVVLIQTLYINRGVLKI